MLEERQENRPDQLQVKPRSSNMEKSRDIYTGKCFHQEAGMKADFLSPQWSLKTHWQMLWAGIYPVGMWAEGRGTEAQ